MKNALPPTLILLLALGSLGWLAFGGANEEPGERALADHQIERAEDEGKTIKSMSKIKRVSPSEAKELMDEGYVYIDVRSEPEFLAGHPEGSVNIPLLHMGPSGMTPNAEFLSVMEASYPKDAKLVLGCRSGGRSLQAAEILQKAGYTDVIDQRAGFEGAQGPFGNVAEKGWRPAGLPQKEGAVEGHTYEDIRKRMSKPLSD